MDRGSRRTFFAKLNGLIPERYVEDSHECRPEHAARYPRLDIEDADKTMYWYHKDWVQMGVTGERLQSLPSPANLAKTERLLGVGMADFCRRRHISICWTARKGDESAHRVADIEQSLGFRRPAAGV
ncbi:DUF6037 family protein [Gordonia hydrophobica]|uniref:DUF6037 family protein n=1 Tax=Gordonia hydrophobica TaxID=40516 RepID=A0ABZ2U379_9ACTN|nr:DUF6037 family protein [Gordonia hydrophobica]MBM7367456.1 hypothetical protein [Gordonia hydrophobica]